MRTENKDEYLLIKNDITYKFIKFDSTSNNSSTDKSPTYLCTFWSSNLGIDPNNFFGREFTQSEYDNLTGKPPKVEPITKKLSKIERDKLKREKVLSKEREETRKAMGFA